MKTDYKKKEYKKEFKNKDYEYKKPAERKTCGKCGRTHEFRNCPAYKSKCHKCNKEGHWTKLCRKPSERAHTKTYENYEVKTSIDTKKPTGNYKFLGEIKVPDIKSWTKLIKVKATGFNQTCEFKIDTGASATILPYNRKLPELIKSNIELRGPGMVSLEIVGMFTAEMTYKESTIRENIYVLKNQHIGLLSRNMSIKLGLVKLIGEIHPHKELFEGLGELKRKYKIQIKKEAKPYSIYVPRPVPIHLQTRVKEELDKMIKLGVIEEAMYPTAWCCPMVVAMKSHGKIRICSDMTKLNEAVKRELYPMATVEVSLAKIQGQIFSKLDANAGFWQIPLEEESKPLTAFLTPWGRYVYNKLPFGLTSAPEIFCREMDKILHNCKGVVIHMDDVLIMGKDLEEHDENLNEVLNRIEEAGMTLNKDKCKFRKDEVEFLGYKIGKHGIKAGEKIQGLRDFPRPTNVKGVRSFLGLINQYARFSAEIAETSHPIRELLKKNIVWIWEEAQENSFRKMKELFEKPTILAFFDINKKSIITTDASNQGIGAILSQIDEKGNRRMIAAASRSLTETEKNYAVIEKEALGVVWGLEKFNYYVNGANITIETDHKPLITLFGKKEVEKIPIRIQRYRLRLMRYVIDMKYIQGKLNIGADALSRYPGQREISNILEIEVNELIKNTFKPGSSIKLQELRRLQEADPVLQSVKKKTEDGWEKRDSKDDKLKRYYEHQESISIMKDCLTYENRLIIPKNHIQEVMKEIHRGHQGINKCQARARNSVWWIGINKDIEKMVRNCSTCQIYGPIIREPLEIIHTPKLAWEIVGTDLYTYERRKYIIVVDYYSRYFETMLLRSEKSIDTINALKSIFARHGIPETLVSDNGSQYISQEFKEFQEKYGFQAIKSSPKHPQGNSVAERAIKTIKGILEKDPYLGLLSYRSTPLSFGRSPAELLMNRKLRTTVVDLKLDNYMNKEDHCIFRDKNENKKLEIKRKRDNKYTKNLRKIEDGEDVYIRDLDRMASVINTTPESTRSYNLRTEKQDVRRNRCQLIPTNGSTYTTRSGRHVKPPDRLIEA